MGNSINFRGYISMFRRRIWIIILIIGLSIGVGVLVKYRNDKAYVPVYQAYSRIRINTSKNNPEQGFSPAVTSLNQNISDSYLGLAKSNSTLQSIVDTLGLSIPAEALSSKISLTSDESNTEFINIRAIDSDPNLAADIANTVPEAYNKELIKTIKLDCVEVIDKATVPQYPMPQPESKVVIKCAAIGVIASIFIVLLLEFLNNKIVTPEDVEEHWGLPLVGVIPYDKSDKKSKKVKNNHKLEVN